MKYAIIKVINGNYSVHAEGFTELASAKTNFHGLCQTLWNAPDVITAEVAIVDENLDCAEGYKEFIHHEPTTVEPEPEPEAE
jgi:hypothetical protein